MSALAEPFNVTARRVLVCPFCDARPGHGCTTGTGKRAHEDHTARWMPLADAYGEGYQNGEANARPVEWYELMKGHQVAYVRPTDGQVRCTCGALCPDDDDGHPGHIIDVMHEHDMVVARLA